MLARPAQSQTLPLQQRKQELVRHEIWSAALDLFVREGFESTTVGSIATAAGLSSRTFFRYFASKEDIILQGLETYGEQLLNAVSAMPAGTLTLNKIGRAVSPLIEGYVATGPHVKNLMRVIDGSTVLRGAQMLRFCRIERRLAEVFGARLVPGPQSERRARLMAAVTMAAINISFEAWLEESGPITPLLRENFAAAGKLG